MFANSLSAQAVLDAKEQPDQQEPEHSCAAHERPAQPGSLWGCAATRAHVQPCSPSYVVLVLRAYKVEVYSYVQIAMQYGQCAADAPREVAAAVQDSHMRFSACVRSQHRRSLS